MSVTAVHQAPVAAHADTATEFGAAVTAAKQQTQTPTDQVTWAQVEGAAVQAMTPFLMQQVQSILSLAGSDQD